MGLFYFGAGVAEADNTVVGIQQVNARTTANSIHHNIMNRADAILVKSNFNLAVGKKNIFIFILE